MELPSPQSTSSEQPPLLRLPAEVRNTIYELIADPGEAIIFGHKAARNLHISLVATCRQLRDEYLPILHDQLRQIGIVQAKVYDLGLGLNKLGRFLDALPPTYHGGARHITVTLVFKDPEAALHKERLVRWARAARETVAYEVDVDWSRHTEATVRDIHLTIMRLSYRTTSYWDARQDLVSISQGIWKALEIRAEELRREQGGSA